MFHQFAVNNAANNAANGTPNGNGSGRGRGKGKGRAAPDPPQQPAPSPLYKPPPPPLAPQVPGYTVSTFDICRQIMANARVLYDLLRNKCGGEILKPPEREPKQASDGTIAEALAGAPAEAIEALSKLCGTEGPLYEEPLLDIVVRGSGRAVGAKPVETKAGKTKAVEALVVLNLNGTGTMCVFIGGKTSESVDLALWYLLDVTVEMLERSSRFIQAPQDCEQIAMTSGYYFEPKETEPGATEPEAQPSA